MEASVHHEPGAPQTVSNINVCPQVSVYRLTDVGGKLGEVNARECMQSQVDIMTLAVLPDGADARLILGIQGIGGLVRVKIDITEVMACSPCQGFL